MNKIQRNIEVVQGEIEAYKVEVLTVIIPGIKQAKGIRETLHKCQAFIEEWFDKMPRLNSYLFWPLLGVFIWMV